MKAGMTLFGFGMLMAFGAVGGMENDGPLVESIILAVVGLGCAYCGTLMIRNAEEA